MAFFESLERFTQFKVNVNIVVSTKCIVLIKKKPAYCYLGTIVVR